jgi:hypothetical protein
MDMLASVVRLADASEDPRFSGKRATRNLFAGQRAMANAACDLSEAYAEMAMRFTTAAIDVGLAMYGVKSESHAFVRTVQARTAELIEVNFPMGRIERRSLLEINGRIEGERGEGTG